MKAIDCACNTVPHFAALKTAGVGIVIRYFDSQHSWKTATKVECDALKAHGFEIVSVFETTATMMTSGFAGGVVDAKRAQAGVVQCGGWEYDFVYFACDTDSVPASTVTSYLDGASSVLGRYNVGIYGSFTNCKAAIDGGHCARAWQTVAWSHGLQYDKASLFQELGKPLGDLGFDYDSDLVLDPSGNVGQWVTNHP